MTLKKILIIMLPSYLMIVICMIIFAHWGSKTVTTISENTIIKNRKTVVIDAGHGGVDGGATSHSGVLESKTNLQIALRLNDLCHLLGLKTLMIRTEDVSVYTSGETIAAKKVSDLKERVRIVNQLENCILISIHQNYFSDNRYQGAQVFYAPTNGSNSFALHMQHALINNINPNSNRKTKPADNIYLMQNIDCTGILIECGFISNPDEDLKLQSKEYQLQLCAVIATVTSTFMNS